MGGDHGPAVTVPAAVAALRRHPDLEVLVAGAPAALEPHLASIPRELDTRVRIVAASQTVSMDEPPARALRTKKDSSMRVAINLVRDGEAGACVSAGNTGALMATARFVLKTIPGIDRPAICSTAPSLRGHVHLLDLGANVDSPPELLLQFGVMGSVMVHALENRESPTVALLNIGVEDIKGNEVIKRAAELFRASNLNYRGFVEGDAIYTGDVDIVVCDGFVGNVAIKTSEGLAQMISHVMREQFNRNFITRLSGLLALPVIRGLQARVDHRRYNGASLIGLQGTVIKSHGSADSVAFGHAIDEAVEEVRNNLPQRIRSELLTALEPLAGAVSAVGAARDARA